MDEHAQGFETLGLDLGPVGRALRIGAGLVGLAYVAVDMSEPGDLAPVPIAFFAFSLLAIGLAYWAADRLVGRRWLAHRDPWLAALVFLGPVAVVFAFDVGPGLFRDALVAYISAAVVLAGAMRYGGCEVVALPMLLGGHRYAAYCPWNAWDAVERPLLGPATAGRALFAAMIGLAALGAGYLYVAGPFVELVAAADGRIADAFALVLLVVAVALAALALGERSRPLFLGAFWAALLAVHFLVHLALFWGLVLVGGLAWVATRRAIGRREASHAGVDPPAPTND